MNDAAERGLSPFWTGLRCRCPRCGKGPLFSGFLTVRPKCPNCALDFADVDTGDGPAVFVIFAVSIVIVAMALWMQAAFDPPYWLQLAIWLPAILVASLGLLRPFKGVLIALQYRHHLGAGFE
jgi:uncharacterized protein (DUF983 family)